MNLLENITVELDFNQMIEISGGDGFFNTLGAAAHRTWNSFDAWADSVRSTHEQYGYIK
ncbi:hypothetical protein [Flavobacterium sp. LS1P3]|jgi:hypothetical protein|uniref:hypothetical protein n=1 Tax=Flavobacterium sp. LS1P3 TaxID=3401720 RepID=UPI003AAD2558